GLRARRPGERIEERRPRRAAATAFLCLPPLHLGEILMPLCGTEGTPQYTSRRARARSSRDPARRGRGGAPARLRRRGVAALRLRPPAVVDARRLPPSALSPHPSSLLVLLRRRGLPRVPVQAPHSPALLLAGHGPPAVRHRPLSLLSPPSPGLLPLPGGALWRPAPLAAAPLGGGRRVDLPRRTGHGLAGAPPLRPPLRRSHPPRQPGRSGVGCCGAACARRGGLEMVHALGRAVLRGLHGEGDRGASRRAASPAALGGGYGFVVTPAALPRLALELPEKIAAEILGGRLSPAALVFGMALAGGLLSLLLPPGRRAAAVTGLALLLAVLPVLPFSTLMEPRYAVPAWIAVAVAFVAGCRTLAASESQARRRADAALALIACVSGLWLNRQDWSVRFARIERMSAENRFFLTMRDGDVLRQPLTLAASLKELA